MAETPWKEAIVKVLEESTEAMHYVDIADAISEKGIRTDFGATPAASVAATITISMKTEGEKCPFVRVSRGYYSLKAKEKSSLPEKMEAEETQDENLISAFGMYWRRDFVLWSSSPKLLGQQQPSSKHVDFSTQKGVYLLHDGSKVVYVGRTTEQPLGVRLKQHTTNRLNGRWDRFSWFGVFSVKEDGSLAKDCTECYTLENLITTMEALLIEGLEPPQNRKRGDEFRAVEFLQVEDPEIQKSNILQLMDELKKKLE